MHVYKTGSGLFNSAIDSLPFELHVPSYNYCGPGTDLKKRLARGDKGINPLDELCKSHDIAYQNHKDDHTRTEADRILSSEAWKRVKSKNASLGERATALAVAAAMKAKIGLSKIGNGLKKLIAKKKKKTHTSKKSYTFNGVVKHTKETIKRTKPKSADQILNCALGAAKRITKSSKKKVAVPRIIRLPKTGGLLPLVPIFAGLSALGTLTGGSAALVRAIGAASEAKKDFNESRRHNKQMEAIAIGKSPNGSGLYLRPFKTGLGLYLNPYPQSKNF